MAAFVIDASATLPWCFADEATDATNAFAPSVREPRPAVAANDEGN
jgi:hypothetical protein